MVSPFGLIIHAFFNVADIERGINMGQRSRMKKSKKMNGRSVITLSILAFIVLGVLVVLVSKNLWKENMLRDYEVVATVNNEPIYVREFKQHLKYSHIAETLNYFKTKYGTEDSKDFWTSSFCGEVPLEVAKKKALDTCISIKVQQALAKENGFIDDCSYKAFIDSLKRENKRRKEAVNKGQVIYGPAQYGENEYFVYTFSNMIIKLKEKLFEKELSADEKTLNENYENLKESLYKKPDTIKIIKISVPFTGGKSSDRLNKEKAREKIELIKGRIDKGESFDELAKIYNADGIAIEQCLDESTARMDSRFNEGLKMKVMNLNPGQLSGIIEENDAYSIVKCIQKKEAGFYPYEEVRDNVKQKYLDEAYEQLIKKMVGKVKANVNYDVYNAVNIR